MSFGPPVFDGDALALDIAKFRKSFAESSYKWTIILGRSLVKEANRGSCRLLRARRERPCRSHHAAKRGDEVAPSHAVPRSPERYHAGWVTGVHPGAYIGCTSSGARRPRSGADRLRKAGCKGGSARRQRTRSLPGRTTAKGQPH